MFDDEGARRAGAFQPREKRDESEAAAKHEQAGGLDAHHATSVRLTASLASLRANSRASLRSSRVSALSAASVMTP